MIQTAIKKVLIVGGGSSGWMTAAYLARDVQEASTSRSSSPRTSGPSASARRPSAPSSCSSTSSVSRAGLDAALQRQLQAGHQVRQLDEARGSLLPSLPALSRWPTASTPASGGSSSSGTKPFDYACFTTPLSVRREAIAPLPRRHGVRRQGPRDYFASRRRRQTPGSAGHEVQYPYGYHFNAAELAEYLQGYAVERGVRRIVDDVVEVPLAEDGARSPACKPRSTACSQADLFVDCTGFRGLLINQALGEPFISFNDSLLNDSAVAIQVPRDIERDGIRPYTTAHGAQRRMVVEHPPLRPRRHRIRLLQQVHRQGRGGARVSRVPRARRPRTARANHIKMRIGRCRNSWVKNCVAIGLSSGFVEPLESTGIFFIQHGIEELVAHFPGPQGLDENVAASYNRAVGECIDGVREFLTIHYFASDRDDTPFWRATKEVKLPDVAGGAPAHLEVASARRRERSIPRTTASRTIPGRSCCSASTIGPHLIRP